MKKIITGLFLVSISTTLLAEEKINTIILPSGSCVQAILSGKTSLICAEESTEKLPKCRLDNRSNGIWVGDRFYDSYTLERDAKRHIKSLVESGICTY